MNGASGNKLLWIAIMIWVAAVIGLIVMATCGDFTEEDDKVLNYDTVVVYNSDLTEVLYSNTNNCSCKEIDGKLIVIVGKDN